MILCHDDTGDEVMRRVLFGHWIACHNLSHTFLHQEAVCGERERERGELLYIAMAKPTFFLLFILGALPPWPLAGTIGLLARPAAGGLVKTPGVWNEFFICE